MKSFLKETCLLPCFFLLVSACHQKKEQMLHDATVLHQNQDQLTQIIIYDVFTPPVSSRIYLYSSLASFEAILKPGKK